MTELLVKTKLYRFTFQSINLFSLATCLIEKTKITTFDNVQYDASVNNCEHVVMAVAAIDSFAIIARQEGTQKV